jgi:hypothetical protein
VNFLPNNIRVDCGACAGFRRQRPHFSCINHGQLQTEA